MGRRSSSTSTRPTVCAVTTTPSNDSSTIDKRSPIPSGMPEHQRDGQDGHHRTAERERQTPSRGGPRRGPSRLRAPFQRAGRHEREQQAEQQRRHGHREPRHERRHGSQRPAERERDVLRHPALHARARRDVHPAVRQHVAADLRGVQQPHGSGQRDHAAAHLTRHRDRPVDHDDVASHDPLHDDPAGEDDHLAHRLPSRDHDPSDQDHLVAGSPGVRTRRRRGRRRGRLRGGGRRASRRWPPRSAIANTASAVRRRWAVGSIRRILAGAPPLSVGASTVCR